MTRTGWLAVPLVHPAELAEMRRLYPFAQADTHMLVDSIVRLRCLSCTVRPVAREWFGFGLCARCLDAKMRRAGLRSLRPRTQDEDQETIRP